MKKIIFLLLAVLSVGAVEIPAGRENALVTREFKYGGSSRSATARVWRDAVSLNVELHAEHPGLDYRSLKYTGHDQDVYRDDTLEVFIDSEGRQRAYYQIIANVNGAIFDHYRDDLMHSQMSWDSGAVASGHYGEDFYEITLSIPLGSLNLGKNPSREIGLAVGSFVSLNRDACSAWGEYHKPMTWQRFTLSGEYPVILKSFRNSGCAGKQPFEVTLQNVSDTPIELTGDFNNETLKLNLPPDEIRTLQFYANHSPGEPTANVLRLNSGGKEVLLLTRIFTPVQLLEAFLTSPLLYENDPIRITGKINEIPTEPLEISVRSGTKAIVKKFTVAREFTVELPHQETDGIECRYKEEKLCFKLEIIRSPWGGK